MDYGSLHLNWNSGSFELMFFKGLTSKSHSEPKLLKLTTESIPHDQTWLFSDFSVLASNGSHISFGALILYTVGYWRCSMRNN